MIQLKIPSDATGAPYVAGDVYDLCIHKVRNPGLKTRLQGVRAEIENAAADYHSRAIDADLHLVPRSAAIRNVAKCELMGVYERMTDDENLGRSVYNRIMIGAPGELCPLCGLGQVKTLDHHLPQAHYTSLCVNPPNLVPACRDCQSEKKAGYPQTKGAQTLHPYYDKYQDKVWLRAEVVPGTPAAFRYFVDDQVQYSPIEIERLKEHVKAFGLAGRFSVRAAEELQNIRSVLDDVLQAGGMPEVRQDLEKRATSSEAVLKNSWRSAMFRGGAASEWFCNGGFSAR